MSTLPKPSEGGDFVLVPAGAHPALCYRIVDLGTQTTSYKGEEKVLHQILIGWELKGDDTIMEDGRPMSFHRRYTWSMGDKANLRKDLESWRGVKFTERDFGPGGFDVRKLLGAACMISVVHKETDDKVYANMSSIMRLPKGMMVGSLINEPVYLWLSPEGFDPAVFEQFSESLKATIRKSPEYLKLMSNGPRLVPAMSQSLDNDLPF